ncbi:hypothetical protein LZ30DRAFT_308640 [Colletotrichum cereale]|nr:hypothetical protein LZ30DRAFT_308640 [Colletotrichum cereale]
MDDGTSSRLGRTGTCHGGAIEARYTVVQFDGRGTALVRGFHAEDYSDKLSRSRCGGSVLRGTETQLQRHVRRQWHVPGRRQQLRPTRRQQPGCRAEPVELRSAGQFCTVSGLPQTCRVRVNGCEMVRGQRRASGSKRTRKQDQDGSSCVIFSTGVPFQRILVCRRRIGLRVDRWTILCEPITCVILLPGHMTSLESLKAVLERESDLSLDGGHVCAVEMVRNFNRVKAGFEPYVCPLIYSYSPCGYIPHSCFSFTFILFRCAAGLDHITEAPPPPVGQSDSPSREPLAHQPPSSLIRRLPRDPRSGVSLTSRNA